MGQSTNSAPVSDDPAAGAFAVRSSLTVPYVRLHNDELGEIWWVSQHPARRWYAGAAGECFLCGWMTFDHQDSDRARKVIAAHVVALHADSALIDFAALLRRIVGAHGGDMACGSMAGYRRHRRAHEPACGACLAGMALYFRVRRLRRHAGNEGGGADVAPADVQCLGLS